MSTEDRLTEIADDAELMCADMQFGSAEHRDTARYTSPAADLPQTTKLNERRYLIASITKPIVGMAVLKLAAEGHVCLADRIGSILPEFSRAAYRRITVRNLLTHTSGFPDMLPNNASLRASHAGLDQFLSQAAGAELEFTTATDCRYSSVGFLILGAIVEKVSGRSLPSFLQKYFFGPLGMSDTRLGLDTSTADDFLPTVVPSILPDWQPNADDWGWNSRYWRSLGAPWGGMLSTASDLGRYATMMLSEGSAPDGRPILPPSAVRAAASDQIQEYAAQPGFVGPSRSWGFGWRRQWAAHPASFGDFVSSAAFGHWGATGTLLWIDPCVKKYAVILTSTPYENSRSAIQRLSNVAATR